MHLLILSIFNSQPSSEPEMVATFNVRPGDILSDEDSDSILAALGDQMASSS